MYIVNIYYLLGCLKRIHMEGIKLLLHLSDLIIFSSVSGSRKSNECFNVYLLKEK